MKPRGEEWEARKRRYYLTHERVCAKCGYSRKKSAIHLHHLYYTASMGREPDDHLMAVCDWCHQGIHNLARDRHLNVADATRVYEPSKKHSKGSRKQRGLVIPEDGFSHLLPPDMGLH